MIMIDQRTHVVQDLRSSFIIQAPAGSGKTTLLLQRYNNIVQLQPDAHVLFITFSRASQQDIASKIQQRDKTYVHTVDSLASHITKVRPVDSMLLSYELFSSIDRCKRWELHSDLIHYAKLSSGKMLPYNQLQSLVHQLFITRDQYHLHSPLLVHIDSHSSYDYIKICYLCINMLRKPNILSEVRHIFFDEIQDLSLLHKDLLHKLVKYRHSLESITLVGDVMQSIYSFRQSDVKTFQTLWHSSRIGNHHLIQVQLTDNFRSHYKLVDQINKLSLSLPTGGTARSIARSDLCGESSLKLISCSSKKHHDGAIKSFIDCYRQKHPTRNIAVLVLKRSHIGEELRLFVRNHENSCDHTSDVAEEQFIKLYEQAMSSHSCLNCLIGQYMLQHDDDLLDDIHFILQPFYERNITLKTEHIKQVLSNRRKKTSCKLVSLNIMTIFQSKGLEVDCVIMPNSGRTFLSNHRYPFVTRDKKIITGSSDQYFSVLEQAQSQIIEEKIRILYVALTRARYDVRLYYVGKPHINSFANYISDRSS